MEALLKDIRFAGRNVWNRPGFTAIVVITLSLGIGANAAIFSVINSVLFHDLPYQDPDGIVTLWENNTKDGIPRDDVSPANFLDWRERQNSFSEMAFANPDSVDYTSGDEPEVIRAALVSKGFFQLLGTSAIHGRTFLPEEYEPGRNQVVILSYGAWQRRFGGERSVVGRSLTLDGTPTTVVGVMPPDFRLHLFEQEDEMWAPQVPDEVMKQRRKATYLKVVARLKPGVTVDQAQADLNNISSQLAHEYPNTNEGIGITAVTLPEHLKGKWRRPLWILFGAVGLVLVIACANVANLLLARACERQQEFAIRAAIGAGRRRLIRQLLIESALFGILGSIGGLLLASWIMGLIVSNNPGNIPRIEQVGLNTTTLVFVTLIGLLTTLIFGLAPALQFSRPDLHTCLKETGRPTTVAGNRLRSTLVIAQIALTVVLLIGAGLLLRSFVRLLNVDPGFAADKVVAIQAFIWARYTKPETRETYTKATLERIESLPGVEAAGVTTALPLLESSQTSSLPFVIEGESPPSAGQEPVAQFTIASPNYFSAIGARLINGRPFSQFDTKDSPPVALINETMARRNWTSRGLDPVGRRFTLKRGGRDTRTGTTLEVIGVVTDQRQDGLERSPRQEFFIPYSQSPTGSIIFVVRTKGEPDTLLQSLKARIWESDKTQPFYAVTTLDQLVDESLKTRRFNMVLLGALAGLALTLAAVGIYGVISFTTRQRTREIGVRMALGAQTKDILRLVIGKGMLLALIGLGLGLVAALIVTRFLSSLLFSVGTTDFTTFAVISLLLICVALLATYLPARRATKVDPLVALRYE
jgi:putative ABC transport system permease protein